MRAWSSGGRARIGGAAGEVRNIMSLLASRVVWQWVKYG